MTQAALLTESPIKAVEPLREMGAYEWLWLQDGATFPRLASRFAEHPGWLPSDFVDREEALKTGRRAVELLRQAGVMSFGVRTHRAGEYPAKLRDARHPVELLYFQGIWDLVEAPSVSIVGTRNPTREGVRRARKLTKLLTRQGWSIVSGLAAGIDTVAHQTALAHGGRTIAVLGTALTDSYPPENRALQARIGREHLLISQVPILRYSQQGPRVNRFFFPQRNVTMSALTKATIIVEAGETSGTLVQARAALHQSRSLFVLESCFQRPDLTWPHEFAKRGAVRVAEFEQITDVLGAANPS